MRRHSSTFLLTRPTALLAFLALACNESASPVDHPAITLSVNSVTVTDILDTGPGDSVRFLSVAGATRLSNGVVVVADAFENSVRFMASDGSLLRTVGRRGSGPGEFKLIGWLGQCGADTIYIRDGGLGRVVVMDTAGAVLRRIPALFSAALMACSQAGAFVTALTPHNMPRPSADDPPTYSSSLLVTRALTDTLGHLEDIPLGDPRPLRPRTHVAIGRDRVYVGRSDSSLVQQYDFRGNETGVFRLGMPSRRPTPQNVTAAIDQMVEMFPDPAFRSQSRAYLLAMPLPEILPFYSDLFVSPDDMLWVVTSSPGDDATQFRVLSPDGHIRADVTVPINIRVREIGADHILGTHIDEGGRVHLLVVVKPKVRVN